MELPKVCRLNAIFRREKNGVEYNVILELGKNTHQASDSRTTAKKIISTRMIFEPKKNR